MFNDYLTRKILADEMCLLRILSQINHKTEKNYFDSIDNIKKDVHDLRGFILYLFSAQKAYKDNEEHNFEEQSYLLFCIVWVVNGHSDEILMVLSIKLSILCNLP